jgi:hypothetical protein
VWIPQSIDQERELYRGARFADMDSSHRVNLPQGGVAGGEEGGFREKRSTNLGRTYSYQSAAANSRLSGMTPGRRRSALDSVRQQPQMAKKLIAPSKRSYQLMRQISALDMSDPVLSAHENSELQRSSNTNLFDDMSLGDLPQDMRDTVSIVSDHTATAEEGLDLALYHSSLSDTNLHMSISEFSQTQLSLSKVTKHASNTREAPTKTVVSSDSIDLQTATEKQRESSHRASGKSSSQLTQRKKKKQPAMTEAKDLRKLYTAPSCKSAEVENLNASLVSLDLEDVMRGEASLHLDDLHTSHSAYMRRLSDDSRGQPSSSKDSEETDSQRNSPMSTTGARMLHQSLPCLGSRRVQRERNIFRSSLDQPDSHLLDIVYAMEEGNDSQELIDSAMHDSLQNFRFYPDEMHNSYTFASAKNPRKVPLRSKSTTQATVCRKARGGDLHKPPVAIYATSHSFNAASAKQRTLPSMAEIFPLDHVKSMVDPTKKKSTSKLHQHLHSSSMRKQSVGDARRQTFLHPF